MADVNWPSTLPIPNASGFAFVHKPMGVVLPFASGRRRVTRTRMVGGNGFIVTANFQFQFTLDEYVEFSDFYNIKWKKFSPQQDRLVFTWEGQVWSGWPTTTVSQTRSDNGWLVSFGFECTVPQFGFTFTPDELDPRTPMWPNDQFGFQTGAKFDRISRDEIQTFDNLLISRSNIKGDKFVLGEITVTPAPIEQIFKIAEWWGVACKHGALPFKIPASVIDLGWIDGMNANLSSGYYMGKILSAPKFSFDGYFGTVGFTVALSVFQSLLTSSAIMVGHDGARMGGNNGTMIGSV